MIVSFHSDWHHRAAVMCLGFKNSTEHRFIENAPLSLLYVLGLNIQLRPDRTHVLVNTLQSDRVTDRNNRSPEHAMQANSRPNPLRGATNHKAATACPSNNVRRSSIAPFIESSLQDGAQPHVRFLGYASNDQDEHRLPCSQLRRTSCRENTAPNPVRCSHMNHDGSSPVTADIFPRTTAWPGRQHVGNRLSTSGYYVCMIARQNNLV